MSNPIFDSMPNSGKTLGIMDLFSQVCKAKNPNEATRNLLETNPQFQGVMSYISQNGGDARTAFYNLAAQKGIDPNTILSQLK